MAEEEIRIDESPRRGPLGRLGHKVIINNSNQYEVQMPPEHLLFQVIETFLAQMLPAYSPDALPEERLRADERCLRLIAELRESVSDEKYEEILATLAAHRHDPHDPRWIRVMKFFDAVEDERYTILEIEQGELEGHWKHNHVEARCWVKQARKPFAHTGAHLAAVHAETPHPSLASLLPHGMIRLASRVAGGPSLRDFGTTSPRLSAVSIKKA